MVLSPNLTWLTKEEAYCSAYWSSVSHATWLHLKHRLLFRQSSEVWRKIPPMETLCPSLSSKQLVLLSSIQPATQTVSSSPYKGGGRIQTIRPCRQKISNVYQREREREREREQQQTKQTLIVNFLLPSDDGAWRHGGFELYLIHDWPVMEIIRIKSRRSQNYLVSSASFRSITHWIEAIHNHENDKKFKVRLKYGGPEFLLTSCLFFLLAQAISKLS